MRSMNWAFVALVAVVGLALVVFAFEPARDGMESMRTLVRERFPEVRQLAPADLAQWLADTNRPAPLLLDVRTPTEFAVSHLPGARQVDPAISGPALAATLSPDRAVVVYCSVGYRSSDCATRLLQAGFTNVMNLEGSIFQWANDGHPVERDGQRVHEVHPYNATFGKLLHAELRPAKVEAPR
jgi:rhodanese-related sulfurtransferase